VLPGSTWWFGYGGHHCHCDASASPLLISLCMTIIDDNITFPLQLSLFHRDIPIVSP
jgi:hypothetical protein